MIDQPIHSAYQSVIEINLIVLSWKLNSHQYMTRRDITERGTPHGIDKECACRFSGWELGQDFGLGIEDNDEKNNSTSLNICMRQRTWARDYIPLKNDIGRHLSGYIIINIATDETMSALSRTTNIHTSGNTKINTEMHLEWNCW